MALVDAWDFHDKALNSTIGRYDGNVYEAQYMAAVKSPLNSSRCFLQDRIGYRSDYIHTCLHIYMYI